MRLLRRLAAIFFLATSFPGVLLKGQIRPKAANTDAIEKEIIAAEELKNQAMQQGNSRVLEQIYADDLIFVNARGHLLTKGERVKEFTSGNVKYISFYQEGYQFHLYGDTAILTGYSCSVVIYHGRKNRIPRRFTSTYVKLHDRWRFVAHQATLVRNYKDTTQVRCKD